MLAVPSAASATTQTAGAGNVTASFSFQGSGVTYRHLHLTIARAGQVLYNSSVRSRFCASPYCSPIAGGQQPSVHVLNLQPGGQPDVVVELFTGGAHCCEVEQVYSLGAGKRSYVKTERNFGNAGATIHDLGHNGVSEFVGADDAFFYAFTSYAASGAPIQIWSFRAHRFINVTRRYPGAIERDAAFWWGVYSRHYADGEGLVAAWAADEELLGHAGLVNTRLASEARKNHLHSAFPGAPQGTAFISALQSFLRKLGYVR